MAAGSVCGGGGIEGFLQSWRSTLNGLEAVAEAHNDSILILDELALVSAEEAEDAAYMLSNGQGKNRMNQTLGTARKPQWRLIFLSTGELTLAAHAASAGKRTRGGVEVRVLNIEAGAGAGLGVFENLHGYGTPAAFADALKDFAREHFGAPFRAYLEALTSDTEARIFIDEKRRHFLDSYLPPDANGEVKRAASRFALIGAGGELATEYGITGWRPGEALQAAARCFRDWLNARGGTGSFDAGQAVNQVRLFIEKNPTRFQITADDKVINRVGYRRTDAGGKTEYLFLQEAFKTEVCGVYPYQMVLEALANCGHLRRQGPDWTIKTSLPGLDGQLRVYAVRSSILEDK